MDIYQNNIGETLGQCLEQRKGANSCYSLRAFARDLDIGAGTLSAIINGKRKVSKKTVEDLADKLDLDPEQRSFVLDPFLLKDEIAVKKDYYSLSEAEYEKVSSWVCFAILSLIRCDDFQSDHLFIAERLGVTVLEVEASLQVLQSVGRIRIDEDGVIARNENRVTTTNNIPSLALRESHARGLEIAKEKVFEVDIEQRHYQTITMAIDPKRIPQAKELINRFLDDLSSLLESGDKTEVYRFSSQLFPLTQLEEKNVVELS